MKKYLITLAVALSMVFGVFLYAQGATTTTTSETIYTGSKVTLKATADGTLPITFYWYKNGTFVGVMDTMVFDKIALTDAGTYTVTAKNIAGEGSSDPLTIIVITPSSPSNVKITIIKG
jgi:hypothetical protein